MRPREVPSAPAQAEAPSASGSERRPSLSSPVNCRAPSQPIATLASVPARAQAPSIPDPKPPIDAGQAAKLLAKGLTYVDIGAELGYRPSSIRRRLLEEGVRRKRSR